MADTESTLRDRFTASPEAPLDATPPAGAQSVREIEADLDAEGLQRVALGCILLRHGHLEPAHDHAQAISGPYGDWLHAIMHRMEGDYGNSRYWCGRAGGEELYDRVAEGFTPKALTDRVEALAGDFTGDVAGPVRERHNRELAVLFEHCVQA